MVIQMAKYDFKGSWYTPNELSEMSGIPAHTLRDRLRRGYSIEEAITAVPTQTSVKEFCDASLWEDWIGMSMSDLYEILVQMKMLKRSLQRLFEEPLFVECKPVLRIPRL